MVKMITDGPGAAAGAGDVEDLQLLAREAKTMQAGEQAAASSANQAQQQAQAAQQAEQINAAVQEVAGVLCVVRDLAAEIAHELDKLPRDVTLSIWTDDRIVKIAAPAGALAEKHGAVIQAFMEKWGPLLMLGASLTMPTVATIKAARAYRPLPTTAREVPAGEGAPGG